MDRNLKEHGEEIREQMYQFMNIRFIGGHIELVFGVDNNHTQ